jgi:hypothetical protein
VVAPFEPGEVVSSARLRLSKADPQAPAQMPWLGAALAPEWTNADLKPHLDAARGVLIAGADGAPLGLAVILPDVPVSGAVALPFLAIEPQRRFRGLGGEASLALERHLRRRLGTERFYAPVPDGRGLAVYFWLRLGYRPLLTSLEPAPVAGLNPQPGSGIWMLRDRP